MDKKYKILSVCIVFFSVIYLGLGLLNNNLWFDETYSVTIINHSFIDICKIAANDVHPILYYLILKMFSILFGKHIIVYRIASLIPIVLLVIFALTKLSKEFGNKTAIIFSFIVIFMPVLVSYSTQIRMYTWSMLFVSLSMYYVYMVIKYSKAKNWILFATYSIIAAYTHYYALFTIAFINIFLIIFAIKTKKINIRSLLICAITEIIMYIPGIIVFLIQYSKVVKGFWISVEYPDILFRILDSNFSGVISNILVLIFAILITIYIILSLFKMYKNSNNKTNILYVLIPLLIYISVIIFALLASIIRPVFITRYMLPMLGLYVFSLSYILSNEKNKWIPLCIISFLAILSIYNSYLVLNNVYTKDNEKIKEIVAANIEENDIILFSDIGTGSIISTYFTDYKSYFYNKDNWDVEESICSIFTTNGVYKTIKFFK